MTKLIPVNLTKEVKYSRRGQIITLRRDTVVLYDSDLDIGHFNGDSFDLFRDEFQLTN